MSEQSVEFPQKKMYEFDGNMDVTPFIRSSMFFDPSLYKNEVERISEFISFRDGMWEELKALLELCANKKNDIVIKQLKDILPKQQIENDLDIVMALHHLFIMGYTKTISSKSLPEYTQTAIKINELFKINQNEVIDLIVYLNKDSFLSKSERKIYNLLDKFGCNIEKLLPVIIAKNMDSFAKIDCEELGISTVSYEELNDFYSDSYELLLELVTIIIGLNNLSERGEYKSIIINTQIKAFDDIVFTDKYKRRELIVDDEPFSRPIVFNNRVRNSIAHYDVEMDELSQVIKFTDNHRGKSHTEEIYFIEFAEMCVNNFNALIYILELIYNLRKIEYISKGSIPHYKSFDPSTFNRKIGRNEPCPCGSGKKYKYCCGK